MRGEQNGINIISIDGKNQNGQLEVTLDFTFCPNPYNYWGIYYTENGEPSSWRGNLEKVGGMRDGKDMV